METEIIGDATLTRYFDFLTNEEIFGIMNGRFTGFGAFDPSKNRAAGVLTALVMQDFILIRPFSVAPDYDKEEVVQQLVSAVCDLPDELKMPLLIYGTEEDLDEDLLEKLGFVKDESDYSYLEGTIGHLRKVPSVPERSAYELRPLEEVPAIMVQALVGKKRKAMSDWMRSNIPDVRWFSGASPVCLKEKKIVAALLMEEDDPCITVQMMFGDDSRAMVYCFSALREVLAGEFAPDKQIRVLLYHQEGKEAISELIADAREKKIHIYTRREGVTHESV